MDIMIIGNPVAGTGKTVQRVQELVRILESRGHKVEVFFTGKPGDAFDRAGTIRENVSRVVIAGGDGTVNEVLNGLPDPSQIPILHMPTGTANQLAHHLCLPSRPEPFAAVVESGTVTRVDMGLVGSHRFLLQVSAGFDALVTKIIHDGPKRSSGYFGYAVPILKSLGRRLPNNLDVSIDGGRKLPGGTVMIMKVRKYGGIFVFSDAARLDSGQFDICLFRKNTIPHLFMYAVAGLTRLTWTVPGITRLRGTRVRIESSEPVPVQTDGTYYGTTPVEIELRASIVPVVVPPEKT